MLLTSMAIVGFTLAKIVLRLNGHEPWADASDDLVDGTARLLTLRKRRAAKSLANDLAKRVVDVDAHGLAENDRRAAIDAVDRLMEQIGDDLAVEVITSAGTVWPWVLEHGGQKYQKDLALVTDPWVVRTRWEQDTPFLV